MFFTYSLNFCCLTSFPPVMRKINFCYLYLYIILIFNKRNLLWIIRNSLSYNTVYAVLCLITSYGELFLTILFLVLMPKHFILVIFKRSFFPLSFSLMIVSCLTYFILLRYAWKCLTLQTILEMLIARSFEKPGLGFSIKPFQEVELQKHVLCSRGWGQIFILEMELAYL